MMTMPKLQSGDSPGQPRWRRWFSGDLWHNGDFLRLWSAQTTSVLGSQVTTIALPLLAILTLEATASQIGILRAAKTLPALLLGLFVGVIVDRLRRRPILIWTDIGRGLVLALVPLAALVGIARIELLYVVAFVVGTLTLFFNIAYFSYTPSIVDRNQLVEANSKLEGSYSVSQIAGPGMGGVLVQLLTAPIAILVDAVSFLASALLIRNIRAPETAPAPRDKPAGVFGEIREGLSFVLRDPILRVLAASATVMNFGLGVFSTVFILYLTRDLDISPVAVGVIFGFVGPGFLIGAFIAGRVTERFGIGPTLIGMQAIGAVAFALIPLAGGPTMVVIALICVANLISGIGGQIAGITNLSLRQHITPGHLLGRMNATMRVISWSAAPLAALLGGVAGDAIGLRPTLFIAVGLIALAMLPIALSSIRKVKALPEGDAVSTPA
jgi:MFS family permease